jgi:hypothetical protein
MSVQHDHDFYTWALRNARLLREGRLDDIPLSDRDYIAEELEDMGVSKERELESRLGILMAHLLKWSIQPERRSNSWIATIKEQRRRLARLLRKNPGLQSLLDETFLETWGDARLIAARETNLPETAFPDTAPFTLEQVLQDDYWPADEPAA